MIWIDLEIIRTGGFVDMITMGISWWVHPVYDSSQSYLSIITFVIKILYFDTY